VLNLQEFTALLVCISVCFVAAGVGSYFTVPAARSWYPGLAKPAWTPPSWLFGPVWTALYTLMGISLWLVWRERGVGGAVPAVALFGAQLTLNALWTVVFFGMRAPGAAFAEIVALLVSILATILAFAAISRVAAVLLVPYFVWSLYAAALNYAVWQLNR
jgi:tryptophan-rich sensory protein